MAFTRYPWRAAGGGTLAPRWLSRVENEKMRNRKDKEWKKRDDAMKNIDATRKLKSLSNVLQLPRCVPKLFG